MDMVHKAETRLAELFKDLPNLPDNIREVLVKVWPYLALIGGVLQLLAAWGLWSLFAYSDRVTNFASNYSVTPTGYSTFDRTVIFIALVVLAIEAVILLMAYAPLMKRSKRGWDLIFIVALISLVYAVLQIFMFGSGIGGAIGSLIGSAIGLYLLFQIRPKYLTAKHPKASAPKT